MKIQILGTAAGDGIPTMFCGCRVCEWARSSGGRNIRLRSCALINDKVFIDFSRDINTQCIRFGLRPWTAKGIFFTHSHIDHLASEELCLRDSGYCDLPEESRLPIYCNQVCEEEIRRAARYDLQREPEFLTFHRLAFFEPVQVEELTITPLPANHVPDEDAMVYLIEEGSHRFFYCLDTTILPERTLQFLQGKRLEGVCMDCTYGGNRHSGSTHMGFGANQELKRRLISQGSGDDRTSWILTHFSHHSEMTHEELVEMASSDGFEVAYDVLLWESAESCTVFSGERGCL